MEEYTAQAAWLTAKEANETAEEINKNKSWAEVGGVLTQIKKMAERGLYKFSSGGLLMDRSVTKLRELGYNYELTGKGAMNEYTISWVMPASAVLNKNTQESYSGKILFHSGHYQFIEGLIRDYDCVNWVRDVSFSSGGKPLDVVVYEAGIRGPSPWYFLNKDYKWQCGNYTDITQTYDNVGFIKLIKQIEDNNTEYETKKD